jgi:hypothetical protein
MTEEKKKDKKKDLSAQSTVGAKKPAAGSSPQQAEPPPADRPSPPEQAKLSQQPGQSKSAPQPGQPKPDQQPGQRPSMPQPDQPTPGQQPAQPKPGAQPSQGPRDWLRSKPVAPKHPAPPSGRIDLGRHDVWTNPPRPSGGKKKRRGGGGPRPQEGQPPSGSNQHGRRGLRPGPRGRQAANLHRARASRLDDRSRGHTGRHARWAANLLLVRPSNYRGPRPLVVSALPSLGFPRAQLCRLALWGHRAHRSARHMTGCHALPR